MNYVIKFLPKNSNNVVRLYISEKTYTKIRKHMDSVRYRGIDSMRHWVDLDSHFYLDLRDVVFVKLYTEKGNPLNHEDHYDDPLN